METQNNFAIGSIPKHIMSIAGPMIVAQLINVLYNVIDRIYIGRIPHVATLAMGGLGICLPIISIIMAFANLFGMGGSPLCSIARGQGKNDDAEEIMGTSFSLLVIFGIILTIVGFIFKEDILWAFGASKHTISYALDYLSIYLIGTIFVLVSLGMNSFINSQGFAKVGMMTVLIGAILNIILDPIFIYVLHMNVAGAALATIISQFVSCIWVLSFLFGKKTIIKIRKEYLLFDKNIMKKILGLGFTPFFMSSTEGILQVAFNRQLLLYGGDLSVSAMTILLSMSQILSLPMEGIAQGAQPIISYNFGAKKYDRVKETIKITIKVALTYSIIGVLLMEAFPQVFVSLFANNTQLIQLSYQLLRIYIFGFIIMGAFSTFQQTYNALGCGKNAFFFAFFRKIILLIPLIYLLPFILPSYGVYAVVLAEPISDLMTTILNGIYFKHFVKKTLA